MSYWPQILAVLYAFGGALAINALVYGVSRTWKTNAHVQRALPMLPVLFGALLALLQWPHIFELLCTDIESLDAVNWSLPKYRGFCVMAGIGQGAVSLNMHKFLTQTLLGQDGIIQAALRKKLQLPADSEGGAGEAD